jgi:mono/diheme cytochrome c family protein
MGRSQTTMRTSILAAVALALLAPGGMASAQRATLSPLDQIEFGRALVTRNCGMCHAVGEAGDSPSRQAPPFRTLHERMDVESLGEGLATGILTRHPAMPEFRFTPHEVIGVVRYLKSIQNQRSS